MRHHGPWKSIGIWLEDWWHYRKFTWTFTDSRLICFIPYSLIWLFQQFEQELGDSTSSILLSTNLLAILRSDWRYPETELWLIDLGHIDGKRTLQTTILSFPQFSRPLRAEETIFTTVSFLSCSAGPDLYQANQRTGETDVLPILLQAESSYKDKSRRISCSQFFLFVSKRHLLQLATTNFEAHSPLEGKGGFISGVENPFNGSTAIKMSYEAWGKTGTRWIDACGFTTLTSSSSYGSRFVCVSHGKPFELNTHTTPPQAETDDNPGDNQNLDSPSPLYVHVLEFNKRLWESSDSSAVTKLAEDQLSALDPDIGEGMPFQVRILEQPGPEQRLKAMIMDRDHMIAIQVGVCSYITFYWAFLPIIESRGDDLCRLSYKSGRERSVWCL